jgi:hypothetical protein
MPLPGDPKYRKRTDAEKCSCSLCGGWVTVQHVNCDRCGDLACGMCLRWQDYRHWTCGPCVELLSAEAKGRLKRVKSR